MHGFTRESELPPGYNHDRVSLRVGEGHLAWERARAAIRLWRAHAHAGIKITPADAPVGEANGTVTAEIVAFSRPADLPTRPASPLARQVQKVATRRYLEGIKGYVAEAE